MATEEAITEVDGTEVNRIIRRYTAIAGASGFIPVPFLDLAALTGVQAKMIHEIGKLHGLTFSEHAGKSLSVAGINALVAPSMATLVGSALKIIPGIGQTLGKFSFHAYAAASTYAIGKLFHNHFASGGSLLTFDADKVKDKYEELVGKYKGKPEPKPAK